MSPESQTHLSTNNSRILGYRSVITLDEIRDLYPLSQSASHTILHCRQEFIDILENHDPRKVVIVGPCSIHDIEAAREYGARLLRLKQQYADRLLILMRVYFEKPRTSIGWKGLINDPHLDDSFDINAGLKLARSLFLELAELGIPAATELLDPIVAAYLGELASWVCIGARTTESQTHRQMASGLSAPVGFKNATEGGIMTSIHALKAAASSHAFLSVDDSGTASVVQTTGNPYGHLVLRGSRQGKFCSPNYSSKEVDKIEAILQQAGVNHKLLIDCSHANSHYDYARQAEVLDTLIAEKTLQRASGLGIMLESHLYPGSQKVNGNPTSLQYGVSITDPCIGFEETEALIEKFYHSLAEEDALQKG